MIGTTRRRVVIERGPRSGAPKLPSARTLLHWLLPLVSLG